MKFSIRYKLFLSHFLAIMFVSGSIGSLFYSAAIDNLTESLRSRLQYSAAILSQTFDVSELDQIRMGQNRQSALSDNYIDKMRRLIQSNTDIEFIYVMYEVDGQVYFILDADTEEPAELGELYESDIPELADGFRAPSADREITTDKWGSFMSGYAPIEGGQVPYLVGIDMRAQEVQEKTQHPASTRNDFRSFCRFCLPIRRLLFSLKGCCSESTVFITAVSTIRRSKKSSFHHPGDELKGLDFVVNYMLDSVKKTQDDLEGQVKKRTSELENANRQLKETNQGS